MNAREPATSSPTLLSVVLALAGGGLACGGSEAGPNSGLAAFAPPGETAAGARGASAEAPSDAMQTQSPAADGARTTEVDGSGATTDSTEAPGAYELTPGDDPASGTAAADGAGDAAPPEGTGSEGTGEDPIGQGEGSPDEADSDPGPDSDGAPGGDCPSELVGFATLNADGQNGTTGGGDATPVEVATLSDFKSAVADDEPRVVVVRGTIRTTDDDGFPVRIGSNKTVVGADAQATIYGGVALNDVSNVILRNLNVQGTWPGSGPDDTISSRNSHHVWYDHLAVWDAGDGLLDITNESSYQTVSYSKFWYTDSSHDHRLASLVGSGGGDHPEDWDRLKVTYHHNWWAERVDSRMPRVVYGQGHVFNNFFASADNGYCIGVGSYGSILVQNNYFRGVNDPHAFMYDVYMHAEASGNVYDQTSGARDTGAGGSRDACPDGDCSIQSGFDPGPFDPPYAYSLDSAESVPELVTRCAGPR